MSCSLIYNEVHEGGKPSVLSTQISILINLACNGKDTLKTNIYHNKLVTPPNLQILYESRLVHKTITKSHISVIFHVLEYITKAYSCRILLFMFGLSKQNHEKRKLIILP